MKRYQESKCYLCKTPSQTGKSLQLVCLQLTVRRLFPCYAAYSTLIHVLTSFFGGVLSRHLCGWAAGDPCQERVLHWSQAAILSSCWRTDGNKGCPPQPQPWFHHCESTPVNSSNQSCLSKVWRGLLSRRKVEVYTSSATISSSINLLERWI